MTAQDKKDRIRNAAIKIYLRTLRRNNQTFADLKQAAERTIEYCKQKRYSEPKFAVRVLEISTKQLDFIACREAELKALRRGTAEGQLGLADIDAEDGPETVPGDPAEVATNGGHKTATVGGHQNTEAKKQAGHESWPPIDTEIGDGIR